MISKILLDHITNVVQFIFPRTQASVRKEKIRYGSTIKLLFKPYSGIEPVIYGITEA